MRNFKLFQICSNLKHLNPLAPEMFCVPNLPFQHQTPYPLASQKYDIHFASALTHINGLALKIRFQFRNTVGVFVISICVD